MAKYKCIYDGNNPSTGKCKFHNQDFCNNSGYCPNHKLTKFQKIISKIRNYIVFPVHNNFKCTYKETKLYKNVCPYYHNNKCNYDNSGSVCAYRRPNNWANIKAEIKDFWKTSF